MIIALVVNSATGNDDLAGSVYQTMTWPDRSTRHCRNQAQYTPTEYGAAAADTGQATRPVSADPSTQGLTTASPAR